MITIELPKILYQLESKNLSHLRSYSSQSKNPRSSLNSTRHSSFLKQGKSIKPNKLCKMPLQLRALESWKPLKLYCRYIKLLLKYATSIPPIQNQLMQQIWQEEMRIMETEHGLRMLQGKFLVLFHNIQLGLSKENSWHTPLH